MAAGNQEEKGISALLGIAGKTSKNLIATFS